MEIKEGETNRGFAILEFEDYNGEKATLQKSSLATDDAIWLGLESANPKIMASQASLFGIKTTETTGWIPFPVPQEVLMHTRMHLTREQVEKLIPTLQHFVKTGEVQFIRQYKSDVVIVRFKDDMSDWNIPDHLKGCIRDIYEVYILDLNRHVHAAELTPSYEMHFFHHEWEGYQNDTPTPMSDEEWEDRVEEIDTLMYEGDRLMDSISYMHVRRVDAHMKKHPEFVKRYGEQVYNTSDHDGENEEDLYNGAIEEAREYWQGNSPFC